MGVPKAAVDKNGPALAAVGEVGFSGEIPCVFSVPQAEAVKGGADPGLGAGVARPNPRHDLRAGEGIALSPREQNGRSCRTGFPIFRRGARHRSAGYMGRLKASKTDMKLVSGSTVRPWTR
jgi:hypothetical protein